MSNTIRVNPRCDKVVFLKDFADEDDHHGSLVSSLASHIVSRSGKLLL